MHLLAAAGVAILFQGYPLEPYEPRSTVDVKPWAWFATLRGDLLSTDEGIQGDRLDLRDDLDIEVPEAVGGVKLRMPLTTNVMFYADFWQGGFEGEITTTNAFTFGASTYPPGTRLETDLDFTIPTVHFGVPLRLYQDEGLRVDLEVGLGVKYLYTISDVSATNTPIPFTESVRSGVPLPVVAARAQVWLGEWFRGEAFANGFVSDIRDFEAKSFEAGIEFRGYLFQGFSATVGYHIFLMDVRQKEQDEEFEFVVSARGFTVGFGYEF